MSDPKQSATFYKQLGFRGDDDVPEDEYKVYVNWFWVLLIKPQDVNTQANKNSKTLRSIRVEDNDAFYQGCIDRGLHPVTTIQKVPSGNHECILRDPDGYSLVFFAKK